MDIHRRSFLAGASAVLAGASGAEAGLSEAEEQAGQSESPQRLRRIATEEAFATPELAEAWRDIVRSAPVPI